MNNPVAAEENVYFELGTKNPEPAHSPSKSDAVIVQRLLCMMTAVIIFCVLTAATTLVLALTMMSRNTSATDCTVVQGKRNKTLPRRPTGNNRNGRGK